MPPVDPIGFIRSPFREKFGIPRQPGLAPDARACIVLPRIRTNGAKMRDAIRGLEKFSHIWVIFVFHARKSQEWSGLVRPPRLGGTRKMGVFATRSPDRPNPIGLSAVALDRIEVHPREILIYVSGVDFLDGTPVLDVKPYVPYADRIPQATDGWAESPLPRMKVEFTRKAMEFCIAQSSRVEGYPNLEKLIRQILLLDPRPAHQVRSRDRAATKSTYAARLHSYDVHWKIVQGRCIVTEIRHA